ncbi:protein translocase SEC61 complex subunit gamma [Candidatus Woesearchaeota archaeon]|nr:MAG: protein translocase SEC61 complex subunit gamma [Candidatus Woesearchaeota archaeon]RLE43134.1 MAG: protein translocase SEC61 complex subunit gamma [Candidatus Woesearchaeota archaeon]
MEQQSTSVGDHKQGIFYKLKRFWHECRRVLKVTRKPTKEEFKLIVKVSGVGILIIGAIGFIIQMIKQLIG